MPLHVDLYEPDGTTFIARLEQTWARQWTQELSEVGTGQVMCQVGTADAARLVPRRVVKLVDADTDTVVAAWVVLGASERFLDTQGRYGQTRSVKGLAVELWLSEAQVYPTLGIGRQAGPHRPFNWAGGTLDRTSGWIAATERKPQEDLGDPPYEDAPAGFPVGFGAYWISARPSVTPDENTPPQRVGDEFFFTTFEVTEQTDASIFWSADDGLEIWLDDRQIAQETEAFLWMDTKVNDLVLDAGWHHIACKLTNIERDNVETNGAAFVLAIHEMLNGGSEVGDPILVTDDSWLVAEVPEPAPTMSPGEILDVLLSEAQSRGCFPQISWSFDADVDSNSEAWATRVDIVGQVNRPMWSVVDQLLEVAVDVRLDPDTLELIVVNKGTLGSDLSEVVVLHPSTNVAGVSVEEEGPGATVALAHYGTGRFTEVAAGSAALAKYGRIEGGVELGSADSTDQVGRVLGAWFDEHAVTNFDRSIEVEAVAGAVPGVDFRAGDSVRVPAVGFVELEEGGFVELEEGGFVELEDGSLVLLVERIDCTEIDPAQDGRVGGTQRFVVHGSDREVLV